MSDLNESTLLEAFINQKDVEEHVKRNIKLSESMTYRALLFCNLYDLPKSYVITLIDHIMIGVDFLKLLIETRDIKLFESSLGRFTPNQSHLLLACQTHQDEMIKLLLNHRLTVDQQCFNARFLINVPSPYGKYTDKDKETMADLIELFIQNGYTVTIEDVMLLISERLYIRDIDRFNLIFNDVFHHMCEKCTYWPYSPKYVPYKIKDINNALTITVLYRADLCIQMIDSLNVVPSISDIIKDTLVTRTGRWIAIESLCHIMPVTKHDLEYVKSLGISPSIRDRLVTSIDTRLKNENNLD